MMIFRMSPAGVRINTREEGNAIGRLYSGPRGTENSDAISLQNGKVSLMTQRRKA
jgi:hypothetical protein